MQKTNKFTTHNTTPNLPFTEKITVLNINIPNNNT